MRGAWSFVRSTPYRAAVLWLTTENSKPPPIPTLLSWPPSGVSTTTRRSTSHSLGLPPLPLVQVLLSVPRQSSLPLSAPSSSPCTAGLEPAALLPSLLGTHPMPIAGLPRSLWAPPPGATPGSAASIIRCWLSSMQLMNFSPAWQSRERASRSLPFSFPSSVSIASGSIVLPPLYGRPCSPGLRIPIRTSRALGSIPRPSSRPRSCLTKSGA